MSQSRSRLNGCYIAAAMFCAFAIFGVVPATGQVARAWPSKPVHMILVFPAGGALDVITRPIDEKLSAMLGQPFIVDNRPGASGLIATEAAAHAPADGYTFLMASNTSFMAPRFLHKRLSYDPEGFEPVSLVCFLPNILVGNLSLPANNLTELIAYMKANPGKLTFGSPGTGSFGHLEGEMLKLAASVNIVHVPFKGLTDAIPALLGGHISLYFEPAVTGLARVTSGKVKAFGVTGARRLPLAPSIPTIAEQGFSGSDILPWMGVVAPGGTSKEITEKLGSALNQVLVMPDIVAKLTGMGVEPRGGSAEEFAALIKSELPRYERIFKAAGITPQ